MNTDMITSPYYPNAYAESNKSGVLRGETVATGQSEVNNSPQKTENKDTVSISEEARKAAATDGKKYDALNFSAIKSFETKFLSSPPPRMAIRRLSGLSSPPKTGPPPARCLMRALF